MLRENEHSKLLSIDKEQLTPLQKKKIKVFVPMFMKPVDWTKDNIDSTSENVKERLIYSISSTQELPSLNSSGVAITLK